MTRFTLTKRLHSASGPMLFSVDEEIPEGEFVALTGASGAGKTTLLRMLAGLTPPDAGSIAASGERWYDSASRFSLPTRNRELGFVFQDAALFPHMSVYENLAYGARRGEAAFVEEILSMAELGALRDRKPAMLSGGQQQRVALARALVRRPKLLLLDEPLSALDRDARSKLQDELLAFHDRFRMTVIMVSHDVPEIVRLAGRVLALESGRVARRGSPRELFRSEESQHEAMAPGEVIDATPSGADVLLRVRSGDDEVRLVMSKAEADAFPPGTRVMVATRAFAPLIRAL